MGRPRTARERRKLAGLPTETELAARIRAAREAAGLTQAQAADRLGISRPSYCHREQVNTLPLAGLLELVRVLGYDPAILCPELCGPSSGRAEKR